MNCLGYESSWVRDVLGASWLGYELSLFSIWYIWQCTVNGTMRISAQIILWWPVNHIYVSVYWNTISSVNGLSSDRWQHITWTNADMWLIKARTQTSKQEYFLSGNKHVSVVYKTTASLSWIIYNKQAKVIRYSTHIGAISAVPAAISEQFVTHMCVAKDRRAVFMTHICFIGPTQIPFQKESFRFQLPYNYLGFF